jgi:putative copper resistance protein D
MAGFIDVLLRGLALCGQSAAIGGVVFAVFALRPAIRQRQELAPLLGRVLALAAAGAVVLALAQALAVAVQLGFLADEGGWPLRAALGTTYVRASLVRILACAGFVAGWRVLRRRPEAPGWWPALLGLSLLLAASASWISHAAARLQDRDLLLALDTVHQLAVAVWVGGLIHLTAVAAGRGERPWPVLLLQRFSATSLAAVATLVAAGIGLTANYVGEVDALVGTAYGMMVLTKVVILSCLLALGALNFFAVRRLPASPDVSLVRLRRFVEVELGLGLAVLFAAASLTSLPPAVDLVTDRASLGEVLTRFTPRWPTLTSPKLEDMPVDDPNAPRTAEDRAWSEFNHHYSGLFVLAMGLLALLHRTGRAPWARHWPLIFLGLAAFMAVRNDPGSWPLGPMGFWESWDLATVLQHRVFVLMVVAFGVFEWSVRTGRLSSRRCALVFPLLCAVGGGLLLTHSHASLNLKEEYLIEVTHLPLGVLAMLVGWTRWLELRLPPGEGRLPGRLWAAGLTMIGLLLLLYRES